MSGCGSDVKNEADCTAHLSSLKGDLTGLVVTLFEADSESGWMKAIASSNASHGLVSVNKAPVKRVSTKGVTPFLDMCRYLLKAGVSHIEWLSLDPARHIQKDPQRLILVVLDVGLH